MSNVEIKDLGYDKIVRELLSLDKKKVSAGLLDNKKNRAQIGYWQEYGTPTIPKRPFMRTTITKYQDSYTNLFAKKIKFLIEGSITQNQALTDLGKQMARDLENSIITWSDPPNAKSTVQKKGFNDPLIEHKIMLSLINFKIT